MKRHAIHHYSEEELLMHILGEEGLEESAIISAHLEECPECRVILREYQQVLEGIHCWRVDEISEAAWQEQKERLMAFVQNDGKTSFRNFWIRLGGVFSQTWDYAMSHPLPTLGYIAVAVAFASQRTISIFRLDQMLPTTGEVIQVLKLVL
jgi:hypothetical protein